MSKQQSSHHLTTTPGPGPQLALKAPLRLYEMHHALSTVEILTEILENCDQNSLTAAIVVSNRWHEVTKRLMWSTCSAANVAALFGMLGWYEPDYTWKAYDTNVFPSIHQWDRFYAYSSVVLDVNVDWRGDAKNWSIRIPDYQLAFSASTHPVHGILFPKLQSLTFGATTPFMFLASRAFLHQGLQAITAHVEGVITEGLTGFIGAAVVRCPDLLHLSIVGDRNVWTCDSPRIPFLIGRMTMLTTLQLSRNRLTGDSLFALLSDLPWLESVDISGNEKNGWLEKALEEGALFEGAFPSLRYFQGDLSKEVLDILIHPHFPLRSLESLTMESCESELLQRLMVIIDQLPLTELVLRLKPNQFQIQNLGSLSTLINLQNLEITSSEPFPITDDELYPLICSWPELNCIRLSTSATTTLRSIQTLLEQCPNISSVDIALDATNLPEVITTSDSTIEGNKGYGNIGVSTQPRVSIEGKGWKFSERESVEEWIRSVGKKVGRVIVVNLVS